MAANRGLFTLDWVVAVAACVALQLICTLDYSSITTLTNDVMASHRAFFADTNALVDASVRRAATRAHAPRLARAAPYLACGDASVEARSARTVSHGAVGVAATATSTPAPGGQWTYRVEFSNSGEATVQLLTRRLTFVNARGEARADAGPGARGATRVLGPGETWAYESAASLTTPSGSFYGTFVFEILKLPPGGGAAFYAGASLSLSREEDLARIASLPRT